MFATTGAMAQTTFERAGAAYSAQRYADAVALYDSVEVENGVSAELYYNRGNAFYKMGKYAPAILNYERALLLDPGNPDIRYNIALANTKITDKIEVTGTFFLNVWAREVRDWFDSNTWATIAVVAFLLFMVALVLYLFTDVDRMRLKKIGFFTALPMLIISAIALASAIAQNNRVNSHNEAIVFAHEVPVKSAPAESATELFILHEGTKVLLREQVGEWVEIAISDGSRGWMPISAIEII
jgi:tetratricopeptide (TPR) repeat protein